ncbi:MAG TPA: tRNA (adenosine(37)-N6)-threonylcarbamoyltransferase complex dimerization subunit type 1 TsaB [Bryobacteraceae bacterium]
MTILALDTTSELGSLAVRKDGATISEVTLRAPEGFAHLIFPAIEELLRETGTNLKEIDCFAAANGPGSFTGIRVGLSAIKGLAEALSKPAIGISNLRALSWFGSLPLRAPLIDARRGEVYTAVYDANLRIIVPEVVLPLAAWLEKFEKPEYERVSQEGALRPLAAAVAYCAETDGPAGWQDPAALDANYVRRSDAELFWKDGT